MLNDGGGDPVQNSEGMFSHGDVRPPTKKHQVGAREGPVMPCPVGMILLASPQEQKLRLLA